MPQTVVHKVISEMTMMCREGRSRVSNDLVVWGTEGTDMKFVSGGAAVEE
jgi:hypothetical protein